MKKTKRIGAFLAIILALSIFTACHPMAPIDPPVNEIPNTDPPDNPPITDPTGNPIVFAYITDTQDGKQISFYDGSSVTLAYEGAISVADPRVVSIDDVLYYFDETGTITGGKWLVVSPDLSETTPASSASRAVDIPIDDVYLLEVIPPQEAYDLGALYREYTRIFENNVETNGPWYMNEWNPVDIVEAASGEIFALDDMKVYHSIDNTLNAWRVIDGGLIFHDFDSDVNTVWIKDETGDYFVPFLRNYFIGAKWQKANGVWYSHNGYEWTGAGGLDETGNALYTWNEEPYPADFAYVYAEYPVFIPGGVQYENGEDVLYWVECNRGDLWRYIPSTDGLSKYASIYGGDGMRQSGVADAATLDPVLIADTFYFTRDATIYQMDMATKLITVFGPEGEIVPW